MKICCVVETPFQMINAINLLVNDEEFSGAEIDLFVHDNHFANSDKYCDRIKELELFNEVNLFNLNAKFSRFSIINYLKNIPQYLFSGKTINRAIGNRYKVKKNTYDIIFTPNACVFFKLIMLCNSAAKVYCYEDGIMSYSGQNWILNSTSKYGQLFMKLIGRSTDWLPERLYVNNTELCEVIWCDQLLSLPNLEKALSATNNIFGKIFGEPECDYDKNTIVFLSQPLSEDVTVEIADTIKYSYITRYHPRDNTELLLGKIYDKSSSHWELICAQNITDKHVLIGACSTAQVSPKWMFDKEPYLIFTYPMYAKTGNTRFVDISKYIVKTTKEIYRNPEKIFVANTADEINDILEKIN